MSHVLVIFGASGDLTKRKLIPALFELSRKGRLPAHMQILGVSRRDYGDDQWREMLAQSTQEFLGEQIDRQAWHDFARCVHYHSADITSAADFEGIADSLQACTDNEECVRLFYMATRPKLYAPAIAHLGASGMVGKVAADCRVVIEKPFGTDLASAQALNTEIHKVFREDQVYRIDHYLGKETVQNLLVLRFANSIFEPVWNRNFVDHVQITVAEEVPVGSRAAYYDTAGILRDMFQNHLLQLMMITAMEAPARFESDLIRNEKVKVLQAVRPLRGVDFAAKAVRGQYQGYRDEPHVPAASATETFAAIQLHVDNWRWQGVPFYLRSGKAMSCRTTQIVIQFRSPPQRLFAQHSALSLDANRLVLQVQPAEGIQLHFLTKVPDAGMKLRMTDLDFSFSREFTGNMPDAYQRLLLDAMHGDASLFARSDEVELAWRIMDPIIQAWQSPAAPELELYPRGDWGPPSAAEWMRQQGREWFDVCPVLH